MEIRLRELPALRRALISGRLTYTKVLQVARHATKADVEQQICAAEETTHQQTKREADAKQDEKDRRKSRRVIRGGREALRTISRAISACRQALVDTEGWLDEGEALARIEQGGSLIVLTTPETLETDDAGAAVGRGRPRLLCVDEAHCISEWGHDFRPAYLRIGAERRTLRIPQVLALTATATPRVRADIARRLRLKDPVEILAPPHRPNLRLSAHNAPGNEKITRAGRILRRLQRPGIVYCATTRAVATPKAA